MWDRTYVQTIKLNVFQYLSRSFNSQQVKCHWLRPGDPFIHVKTTTYHEFNYFVVNFNFRVETKWDLVGSSFLIAIIVRIMLFECNKQLKLTRTIHFNVSRNLPEEKNSKINLANVYKIIHHHLLGVNLTFMDFNVVWLVILHCLYILTCTLEFKCWDKQCCLWIIR